MVLSSSHLGEVIVPISPFPVAEKKIPQGRKLPSAFGVIRIPGFFSGSVSRWKGNGLVSPASEKFNCITPVVPLSKVAVPETPLFPQNTVVPPVVLSTPVPPLTTPTRGDFAGERCSGASSSTATPVEGRMATTATPTVMTNKKVLFFISGFPVEPATWYIGKVKLALQ